MPTLCSTCASELQALKLLNLRFAWLRCRTRTLLQIHVTLAPAGGEIAPPSTPPGRVCRASFDGWTGKGSELTAGCRRRRGRGLIEQRCRRGAVWN